MLNLQVDLGGTVKSYTTRGVELRPMPKVAQVAQLRAIVRADGPPIGGIDEQQS